MIEDIVAPLLEWYSENHRVLPWREHKNPYYIWVSEIMLQQTRVEAVKPYFERFIKALPDIRALAECPEGQLLKLWEGLGYYNRVRNMQKAAQQVIEKHQGQLPHDYEALKGLAGIGSYTAGAIASIAYDIPVPAVDGNVLRVITRILADDSDIMKQSTKRKIEVMLQNIMPSEHSGDLNQALMELGATVCGPNGAPKCEICPLNGLCEARKQEKLDMIPVKAKQKPRRIENKTVLVILDGERVAIRKRPAKGLLAGLYEFPNLSGSRTSDEVLEQLKKWDLEPLRIYPLEDSRHIFSHVEWHMSGYAVRVAQFDENNKKDLLFVEIGHAEKVYPVPAAFATYAKYMNMRLGQEKYETEDRR